MFGLRSRHGLLVTTVATALVAVGLVLPSAVAATPDTRWVRQGTAVTQTGGWGKPVWWPKFEQDIFVAGGHTWRYEGGAQPFNGAWNEQQYFGPPINGLQIAVYRSTDSLFMAGVPTFFGSTSAACAARTVPFYTFQTDYNGGWKNQTTSYHPPAGIGGSLAWDPQLDGVLYFGGYNVTGSRCLENVVGPMYSQTWLWRGGHWIHLHPKTTPAGRAWASMAAYSPTGVVLMFGGEVDTTYEGGGTIYYNGTWAFEGTNASTANWVRIATSRAPGTQSGAGFTYDSNNGAMILAGGAGPDSLTNDTWELKLTSASTGVWTDLHVASPTRLGLGFTPYLVAFGQYDPHPIAVVPVGSGNVETYAFD